MVAWMYLLISWNIFYGDINCLYGPDARTTRLQCFSWQSACVSCLRCTDVYIIEMYQPMLQVFTLSELFYRQLKTGKKYLQCVDKWCRTVTDYKHVFVKQPPVDVGVWDVPSVPNGTPPPTFWCGWPGVGHPFLARGAWCNAQTLYKYCCEVSYFLSYAGGLGHPPPRSVLASRICRVC